jgi:branched-chain amino acid aminotransferase
VGAVGTAAVITPVNHIRYRDRDYFYGKGDQVGPVITKLYNRLMKLQTGDIEDTFNWLHEIKQA